jgi:hypothetical protein
MFKNTFQSGFLSILYSIGSKPLQIWDKEGARVCARGGAMGVLCDLVRWQGLAACSTRASPDTPCATAVVCH